MTDLRLPPKAVEVKSKLEEYFHEPVEVRKYFNSTQESLLIAVQTRRSAQEAITLFDRFLDDFWLIRADQEGYIELLPTIEFPA